MTREAFRAQLDELRLGVIHLGRSVRDAVDEAMLALRQGDLRRSRALLPGLEEAALRRWRLEERTIGTVAAQQPVASDCRLLLAFLSMLDDLGRIGEHARGVAEINGMMGTTVGRRDLGFLPSMADRALAMLDDALRALDEDDAQRARHVLVADDDLDRLQARVYADAFGVMTEDPSRVEEQTYLLWVGHNLERVGDRAENLAESLIYAVTGERELADRPHLR